MRELFERELKKDTVFQDAKIMSPHYIPKELPFRETQIEEISSNLAVTLKGNKANNLFIYGKTGTGKTSTARHVLDELEAFSKEKNTSNIKGIYINCRNHNSKYNVLIKCLKELEPEKTYTGYSGAFIYEHVLELVRQKKMHLILILDEIDKIRDIPNSGLDDLIYALTRGNDELQECSISILGISNNIMFKDRLDPRTKSSLCEKEMVFPPYNAEQLKEIITQRSKAAFKEAVVGDDALNLAAAIAAQQSGDARTAVLLMLRAGEYADKNHLQKITENEIQGAKNLVEEEIILNMVVSLPLQQQLVLYTISLLGLNKKPIQRLNGTSADDILYSGEVYDEYCKISKKLKEDTMTARWYRECITQLEMHGLITTTQSGAGVKGQTRFIKLAVDAEKIKEAIEKEINK